MKHVCLILATFAACIAMMHAAANDYIWSQKPASGPLVPRNLTPTAGRLIGFPVSIDAPATIIIGSGLTLTGSTLTASGGAVSTLSDVTLTSLASGDFLKWNGTAWINRTAANVRSDLGLGTLATQSATITDYLTTATAATTYQPLDADLTTLSSATAAGLALMDDVDASAQRTTLGLGTLATQSGTISSYAPLASPTFTGTVTMPSYGLVFPDGGGVIGMEFGGGLNKITLKTASLSGVKTVTIPSTTGTIVTTGDSGTVTNAMLAGSIDLTAKVTGTLPVANGGTGITSFGTGVATWLGTPTIANLNSAVSDADLAILGANTFSAAQMIDGSADAVQLTVQGHSTQTSNLLLVEKSDGTDLVTVSGTGVVNVTNTSGAALSVAGGCSFANGSVSVLDNANSFRIYSTYFMSWANDLFVGRKAAATLQLGQDAAGVTSQMLTAASRITSDGVGANLTIAGGNGRGGAGGSLIFSTYTTAAASTAGTLTTRLTINTLGEIIPVLPTSAAGLTTGALWNDSGTVKVAP